MSVLMKRLVVFSIIVTILLVSTVSTTASPIYGEKPAGDGPTLVVQKWLSKDQILLGQNVTVFVNITNVSNFYANNLTIREPTFNNFIIKSKVNYERYTYTQLGKGAVLTYNYTIIPESDGTFSVEPTQIDYYGSSGAQYRATSSNHEFTVLLQKPAPSTNYLWRNIMWLSIIFVAIPMVIYFYNRFFMR